MIVEEASPEEGEGGEMFLVFSAKFVQNGVKCKVLWNNITLIKQWQVEE